MMKLFSRIVSTAGLLTHTCISLAFALTSSSAGSSTMQSSIITPSAEAPSTLKVTGSTVPPATIYSGISSRLRLLFTNHYFERRQYIIKVDTRVEY